MKNIKTQKSKKPNKNQNKKIKNDGEKKKLFNTKQTIN
jgi:hypothetical protein